MSVQDSPSHSTLQMPRQSGSREMVRGTLGRGKRDGSRSPPRPMKLCLVLQSIKFTVACFDQQLIPMFSGRGLSQSVTWVKIETEIIWRCQALKLGTFCRTNTSFTVDLRGPSFSESFHQKKKAFPLKYLKHFLLTSCTSVSQSFPLNYSAAAVKSPPLQSKATSCFHVLDE